METTFSASSDSAASQRLKVVSEIGSDRGSVCGEDTDSRLNTSRSVRFNIPLDPTEGGCRTSLDSNELWDRLNVKDTENGNALRDGDVLTGKMCVRI